MGSLAKMVAPRWHWLPPWNNTKTNTSLAALFKLLWQPLDPGLSGSLGPSTVCHPPFGVERKRRTRDKEQGTGQWSMGEEGREKKLDLYSCTCHYSNL